MISGQVSHDDFSGGLKMRAETAMDIAQARLAKIRHIELHWHSLSVMPERIDELDCELTMCRQDTGCQITLKYANGKASIQVALGDQWRIEPTEALLHQLQRIFGAHAVTLGY